MAEKQNRPIQSIVNRVKKTVVNLVKATDKSAETKEKSSAFIHHLQNKEDYLTRLKSFTPSFWNCKPLCLSPPVVAQLGWTCYEEDLIQCLTCSAILTVRIPWCNADNYSQEVKKNFENLKKGHSKICPWLSLHSTISPFDEAYLSDEDKRNLVNEFADRVSSLQQLHLSLPFVTGDQLVDLGLSRKEVLMIYKNLKNDKDVIESDEDHSDEIFISCVVLSLCGWNRNKNPLIKSLVCEESTRMIGLWNFHSIKEEKVDGLRHISANNEPEKKRRKTRSQDIFEESSKELFHPLKQHYFWSPWRVSLNSKLFSKLCEDPINDARDNSKIPGWLVIKKLVFEHYNLNEAPLAEKSKTKTDPLLAIQQAMRLFDSWTST